MARWTGQCRGGVPGAMARAWGSSSVRAGTEAVRWCWGAPPVAVRLKPPLLPPYRRPSLTISRMSSVRSAKLTSGCAAAWGKVPSHATARAAAHRSGGTGTCAPHVTRPSGPERSALALLIVPKRAWMIVSHFLLEGRCLKVRGLFSWEVNGRWHGRRFKDFRRLPVVLWSRGQVLRACFLQRVYACRVICPRVLTQVCCVYARGSL